MAELPADYEELRTWMETFRKTPAKSLEQHSGKFQTLNSLERYFLFRDQVLCGEWDEELRTDADLVFDLQGAPQMLSRALNISPVDLGERLGDHRDLICPRCKVKGPWTIDLRIRGGYHKGSYPCRRCGDEMVDYIDE